MTHVEVVAQNNPCSDYSPEFYKYVYDKSIVSARAIVPIVLEHLNVKSVLDVGCGLGTWLSVFREFGIEKLKGIDGPYVKVSELVIDQEQYSCIDLSKPFRFSEKADLALCLEVGEHLPASRAINLVEQLADSADAVLFSAAIPGQGGTSHINEQWHDYWHLLFERQGFTPCDLIRPVLLSRDDVAWWYRQNIFLYIRNSSEVMSAAEHKRNNVEFEIIRKQNFDQMTSVAGLLKMLPGAFARAVKNRML